MINKFAQFTIAIGLGALSSVVYAQQKPTVNCVNYYEKGTSSCRNLATSVLASPFSPTVQLTPQPALNTPQASPKLLTPTDKFLANYGKPPEEFVDFYLNPTPENARRWATTYQQLQQKSRDIAIAWASAEQTLGSANAELPAKPFVPATPLVDDENTKQNMGISSNPSLTIGSVTPVNTQLIFPRTISTAAIENHISLTYYFSANCPFCARQETELKVITEKAKNKLTFTCVDLTPLSATYKPDPANIHGLPCTWRTATDTEITQEGIRQTPTFKIERAGQPTETLAGYQNPTVLEGLLQ